MKEIDKWLGQAKWDVIHFNFGLHDIKHIDPETGKNSKNLNHPQQANPEQYGKNLSEIVDARTVACRFSKHFFLSRFHQSNDS